MDIITRSCWTSSGRSVLDVCHASNSTDDMVGLLHDAFEFQDKKVALAMLKG